MIREPLLPVADALARILASADEGTGIEIIDIEQAHTRTLASALTANRTQPPFDASAMDGYAARAEDIRTTPVELKLIGESAAGRRFDGKLTPGSCIRIFTGAPVPDSADVVILQEDTVRVGESVLVKESVASGRHIRQAGIDFRKGETLIAAGTRLDAAQIALAAAMNHSRLALRQRPRIGILSTGDELVKPGVVPGADQIISSNALAIAARAQAAGAETFDLGIAADTLALIEQALQQAHALKLDILVTSGGASVGDHDLVQAALRNDGLTLNFWRIAMRPGKPMMFGQYERAGSRLRILGLPGNPVASYVCTRIFLEPLIRALMGDPEADCDRTVPAILGSDVKANDKRQDYLRATLQQTGDGLPVVTPFPVQDSSMLSVLARSNALLLRAPFAPAAKAGDASRVLMI